MLAAKRTQIRRETRRGQIQQQFTLRRKELVQGQLGLTRQLFAEVQASSCQGTSLELVGKLLAYQQSYPLEQNTYIIISNYLFNHNDTLYTFYTRLLDTPRFLENHMWALSLVSHILAQEASRIEEQEQFRVRERMEEVLENACEVVGGMLEYLKQRGPVGRQGEKEKEEKEKVLNIWLYFLEILKIAVVNNLYELLPVRAIQLFVAGMGEVELGKEQSEQLMGTWQCLCEVLNLADEMNDLGGLGELLQNSCQTFRLVLKEIPHQRTNCIQILQKILLNYPAQFMSGLFRKNLMQQLLYILQQLPGHKPAAVNLLKMIVSQCSLQELRELLLLGTHRLLIDTLEWSMNTSNNGCLLDCLTTLYHILSYLNSQQQNKMLVKVKQEIQKLHFDQMVEELSQQSQNKDISHMLNLIIDDFYSAEVA